MPWRTLEEFYRDIIKLNLVSFPVPTDYPQGMGWFKRPIKSLKDLKGMKYRIYGIGAETYGRLGVSVVTLPGGEIVPAMERGVIDAFEFNNPTSDMRFGAQDVIKNYMMGSYHQAMEFFEIAFNKKKHDALSPDLKAILRYAAEADVPSSRIQIELTETAALIGSGASEPTSISVVGQPSVL